METKISPSLEDYLEVIWLLSRKTGVARISQLARNLEIKKPSATAALKRLAALKLVEYQKYGPLKLTKQGESLARNVAAKHDLLVVFLRDFLKVPEPNAERDACRIEHVIDAETSKCLRQFIRSQIGKN